MLGVYYCLFGLLAIIVEIREFAAIAKYFAFLYYAWGKAFYYIFFGLLIIGYSCENDSTESCWILLSACALWWVASQPPSRFPNSGAHIPLSSSLPKSAIGVCFGLAQVCLKRGEQKPLIANKV